MYVGGRAKPRFLSQCLPKIKVPMDCYPDFSSRQLPPSTASFRQLLWNSVDYQQPSPHILLGCRKQWMWGMGRKPNTRADNYLKSEFPLRIILISSSVDFRRQWKTISSCNVGMQTATYVRGMSGANVPYPVFSYSRSPHRPLVGPRPVVNSRIHR